MDLEIESQAAFKSIFSVRSIKASYLHAAKKFGAHYSEQFGQWNYFTLFIDFVLRISIIILHNYSHILFFYTLSTTRNFYFIYIAYHILLEG